MKESFDIVFIPEKGTIYLGSTFSVEYEKSSSVYDKMLIHYPNFMNEILIIENDKYIYATLINLVKNDHLDTFINHNIKITLNYKFQSNNDITGVWDENKFILRMLKNDTNRKFLNDMKNAYEQSTLELSKIYISKEEQILRKFSRNFGIIIELPK